MAYVYMVYDEDKEPVRKLYSRDELAGFLKLRPGYTYKVIKVVKPKPTEILSKLEDAPF